MNREGFYFGSNPGAPSWVERRFTSAGDCEHADTFDGPRIPLRYGSAATLICRSCSAWRQNRPGFGARDWKPADTLEEALREDDEL